MKFKLEFLEGLVKKKYSLCGCGAGVEGEEGIFLGVRGCWIGDVVEEIESVWIVKSLIRYDEVFWFFL